MKDKIIKIIDYAIFILIVFILSLAILDKGIYSDEYLFKYTSLFLLPIILFLIKYLLKPYKLSKKYLIYILFFLTFAIPMIFNKCTLFFDTLYHFLFLGVTILFSIVISEQYKDNKELFYKIILFVTLYGSLVSLTSLFLDTTIPNIYGDFYKSSVDRLYGTLLYPNALGLLNILGIIISFSLLNKNKLYFIPFYINLLTFSLTMSKSLFVFLIFMFICLVYKYRKNTIYLFSIIPLIYNVKMYRNSMLLSNLLLFILITILCILISYLLVLWYKKHKKSLIIVLLSFLIVVTVFPNKELVVRLGDAKTSIIADFMNLEENKDYILYVELEGDINKSQLFIYKKYLFDNKLSSEIVGFSFLKDTNYIKFNTKEDFEYFTVELFNKSEKLKFKTVKLISEDSEKNIILDYKYYPYNYIKMLEQTKYDVGSLEGRSSIYKDSINIVKDNLFIGHGYRHFEEETLKNRPNHKAIEEHSYIFTLLVENGIFSLIIWLILLIYIYYLLIINIKEEYGIVDFLLISVLIFSSLYDFTLSYMWYLLVLLVLSMLLSDNNNKRIIP